MSTEPIENQEDQDVESGQSGELHDDVAQSVAPEGQAEFDELDSLRDELAQAQDQVLRIQAEMENFRKRSRRDTLDQLKYANVPVMRELVDVLDNLTRALDASDQESDGNLVQGLRLVADQLAGVLEAHQCKRIETVGQLYDPNLHESIQVVATDEFPEGTVVQEIQAGYQVYDRVVRPAKVFVSTSK